MDGFDWWASQKPREAPTEPAAKASSEPRPEGIGSVPFMRANRKVAPPGKTPTESSDRNPLTS